MGEEHTRPAHRVRPVSRAFTGPRAGHACVSGYSVDLSAVVLPGVLVQQGLRGGGPAQPPIIYGGSPPNLEAGPSDVGNGHVTKAITTERTRAEP